MRMHWTFSAALLFCLPIGGTAREAAAAPAVKMGALEGVVLDGASGTPVEAARIRLEPDLRETNSDQGGKFAFPSLPAGQYIVEAERVGYSKLSLGPFRVPSGGAVRVELRLERVPLVETVVVQASGSESRGAERDSSPRTVEHEEMLRTPGTLGDPIRALAGVPGVSTVNDFKAEIRIRGGEPEDTLFRVDGVNVDNPYHFRWARASTAALNPDAFERLHVQVSGVGAEVGDALSGVVELFPSERGRDGRFWTASLGTLSMSVTGGGPAGPEGCWLAGMRYSDLALYRSLYNVKRVSVPDFGDLVLRVRRPLSATVELVAGGLGLRNGLSTSDPEENTSDHISSLAGLLYAGIDADLGEGRKLSGRLAWSQSLQKANTTQGDDLVARQGRFQFSLEASGGSGAQWKAGLDASRIQGQIAGTIQTAGALGPLDASATRAGAYGSLRVEPAAGLAIEAGARVDIDSRAGAAPLQPRIEVDRTWASGRKAFLALGRYAQFARFDEEFLAQPQRLGPTTSDELSAGVQFPLPAGLKADVTAYDRRLRDPVSEIVNQFPDLLEPMARFERARVDGLEVGLRKDRGRLQMRVAGTFLKARQRREGLESPRNGDEPWRLDYTAAYVAGPHLMLMSRFQGSAGLPYTSWEPLGGGLRTLGPLNGRRLPAYSRVDLRASFDWGRRSSLRGRFFIEAANILGHRNVRGRDLRWDPRRLRYEIRDEQTMPLLPGFGVELSWGT